MLYKLLNLLKLMTFPYVNLVRIFKIEAMMFDCKGLLLCCF